MPKRLIYFVKLARFSNTNAYVEEQLKRNFPDTELRVIDVKSLYKRPSLPLFLGLMNVASQLVCGLLKGKLPPKPFTMMVLHKLLRTPVMFEAMGRTAAKIIERDRENVLFTIQTQSMWNSAVPGIPNFVYTDSTALANLYFKSWDFSRMPPSEWLEHERKIYSDAKKILVMSGHVERSLTELYGVDPAKVVRIYVGANLKQIPASSEPAPLTNKTILFVGVNWEGKGGPDLLEAFKRLPERHKDAKLVVVGVSPEINVRNVEVVGFVSPEKVGDFYKKAAIFCMPTFIDAFGIVYIEAMMNGVAVAAPRHGAMIDYVKEKDTGVLYTPRDIDGIANALTWLLDNPTERQAIAKRGALAVRDSYTWDAVGHRLRDAVTSSITGAP